MGTIDRRQFMASSAALWLGSPAWATADRLTLAFIPQENPDKLVGDIEKITGWLSERIGVPVEGFVTIDHAAAVEALRNGSADISFMGALPFVLAEAEIGAVPLLAEVYRGSPSYRGRIFVRRDSGISALADLKNTDIAFADPISESGYLYPLDLFIADGLVREPGAASEFFRNVYFAGGYQQAMQAMAAGLVAAAGASQYADLLLTPEQQAEVVWIAESEPIPSHVVIARPELDAGLRDKFAAAMLTLNEPANRPLLAHVYGPDGYVAAQVETYDGVRAIARRYGLLE